ncbi:MAG: hypothetical protein RIC35_12135 [Marinoscillum sp.]
MHKLLLCLLLLPAITVCNGQAKLKEKLSKKANQELDNLLFGKKDKEKNTSDPNTTQNTNESDTEYGSETEDAYGGNDPLGGYKRSSVEYGSLSTTQVVGFRDLINFLPDDFGSYKLSSKPDGSTMKYGEYEYSSGMKAYENGSAELTASIFDYMQTGGILAAYTNKYEYESTEGMLRSIEVSGFPGWFTVDFESKSTSFALTVNNRFLITISGYGISEIEGRAYLQSMDLSSLPKAPEQTGE